MTGSQIEILLDTQFMHGYFKSRRCACLSIRPAKETLRDMRNHGLLLKTKPGGFQLLYDSRHAGNTLTRAEILASGIVVRLLLRLEDADFFNYTTPVPPDISNQVFYFYNRPGSAFLHTDEQVSEKDLVPFDHRRMPGGDGGFERPFAIMDLRLEPGLEEHYQILFQPPATWWNYILVSDHLLTLDRPAIINTNTKETFSGPSTIRLPDERSALAFLSPAPLTLSEVPAAACMLVENFDPVTGKYKVTLGALPGPDISIISGTKKNFSDILLY